MKEQHKVNRHMDSNTKGLSRPSANQLDVRPQSTTNADRNEDEPPDEIKWFIKLKPQTKATLIIQIIGLVIGVIALLIYKSQTDAMHETLTVTNRPWVGVDKVVVSSPPIYEESANGLRVTISTVTITAKNFGPSPALNAIFDGGPFNGTEKDAAAQFKRESTMHCGRAELSEGYDSKTIGSAGKIIFPGTPTTFQVGSNGPANDRSDFVTIIGCIIYRDQFSPDFHHTRICVAGKWDDLSPCPWGQQAD